MKVAVIALSAAVAGVAALQVLLVASLAEQIEALRSEALCDNEQLRYDMLARIEGRAVPYSLMDPQN